MLYGVLWRLVVGTGGGKAGGAASDLASPVAQSRHHDVTDTVTLASPPTRSTSARLVVLRFVSFRFVPACDAD